MESEWSDLAERTEAVAMFRFNAETAPAAREELGMFARWVADGVHVGMRHDPMGGYWNKALGFCEAVTRETVEEVVATAADHGVPALALQLQPQVVPAEWPEIVAAHRLVPGVELVKCFGPAAPRDDLRTDGLRVTVLGPDEVDVFSQIMHIGFEVPETERSVRWFADPTFCTGDWVTFAAWDGDEPVGAARLLVVEETGAGALFGAATVPSARNRGAQSALLDARIREARARGCRYVSTETWAETPENPNPSQHNMRRAGLTEVHCRRNWVWRAPTDR